MNEFVFIIFWIGFIAIIAKYAPLKRKELVCGVEEERYPWLFAAIVFLPIVWMAATRGDIADTINYRLNFQHDMPDSFSGISEYMSGITKDYLFYLISAIIKVIIGNNYVVYFAVLATIQAISLLSIFRKYSCDYVFSVFLFVASADYFWMFNGIRQFLAATIMFLGTALVVNKKFVPLIILIVFASTFHQSALIMIPIVFLVQGEVWNKRTVAFLATAILVIFFVDRFTNLLDSLLTDTQYSNAMTYSDWDDDGTNPFRVAVYCVPAVISFIGRKKINELNIPLINICANMSIVSASLYLVSMVTSGIVFGRLPIYVSLFSYILLPWELNNLFEEDMKKIIYGLAIVLYLIFYYYQMHITWGMF